MTIKQEIEAAYPARISEPDSAQEIPHGVYMVYVLVCDGKPIVVGHGKHNRARVIFDDAEHITPSHIKAIFVRAYHLFGCGSFERYFIACDSKSEAKEIERTLHDRIGGNHRSLPPQIKQQIFNGIADGSVTEMVIRIALNSSFDGIADLKLWRKKGILSDQVWEEVSSKFQL